MNPQESVSVGDSSQVSACRQRATELAMSAGFDDTAAHRVGLVATELATNLVKHAPNVGELFMRRINGDRPDEVEILSVDRGPGILDVGRSLADGYSTAGSAGTGLGAIRRLSDIFDIYSQPNRGTAVVARLSIDRRAARQPSLEVGVVTQKMPGESVCGDAWRTQVRSEGIGLLLVDGLGHGRYAADAASAATASFARPFAEPSEALERIHQALRSTRGAAAAIADVRLSNRIVRFSGVGNISGVVYGASGARHAVSHNGTLGHRVHHFRDYSYPWEAGAVLVMHSDGLSSSWSLDSYPGIRGKHPSILAALLYRDSSRGRDDATVVVVKEAA